MQAVSLVSPGSIEITDVPEPPPGGGLRVRVEQVGICGTDRKIVAGAIPVRVPRILGHEVVGRVLEAPAGSPVPSGARVLVDPGVACGWCAMCARGRTNICLNGGLLGRDVDGVFTETVTVPINRVVAVPEGIPLAAAGLLQVLGTCVHAVRQVDAFPGSVAAVVGLGVSGLLIAQLLTARGATVVGVTRSGWKRDLAVDSGVAVATDPAGAAEVLADMTAGLGPSLVVEAVGTEATLAEAVSLAAVGGEVLVFGTLTGGGSGLPYYELYRKELLVRNPRAAVLGDYADGVALAAAGALRLEPLVTHELALADAARAFELVGDATALKVLMRVG